MGIQVYPSNVKYILSFLIQRRLVLYNVKNRNEKLATADIMPKVL